MPKTSSLGWVGFSLQALVFAAGRLAHAAAPVNLPVEQHRLDNGLQVILAPDDSLPDVTVAVRYDVGSADDPNGLEGLAHLVEHVHFKGSAHVPPGDHMRLLEEAGASYVQGVTGFDGTYYVETIPPEALDLALWLESDRMGFPPEQLDEAAEKHEQTIVSHEYRWRIFDSPNSRLAEMMSNEVFPAWHPYHVPSDGLEAIGNIGPRDVRAFMRTWYTPANARLVLAGPFEPVAALELVTRYFGSIPSVDPPKRPPLPPMFRPGDVVMNVLAPVQHKNVLVAWATPPLHEPGDRELDLAARILTGPNGLLVRELVGRGLAAGVTARQASNRRGSMFYVSIVMADGASVEPVGRVIDQTLAMLSVGVNEEVVARARKWWTDVRLVGIETSTARADRLALVDDVSDPWDLASYGRIDSGGMAAAVGRWLVPAQRVAAVVYPSGRPLPVGVQGIIESREKRMP
jgi:zinc protease